MIRDFPGRTPVARRKPPCPIACEILEPRALLSGVSAAFAVTSDWGSGFGAGITLTNSQATPVNNWVLGFDYSASINQIWDATIVSHSGNHYVLDGAGWNNAIPAGGTVSFGFNGSPGHTTAAPSNYTINGGSLGTSTPSITIGGVTSSEPTSGSKTFAFPITLSAPSTSAVTVHYATSDGTARSGLDYTAASGSVTFAPGQTSAVVNVSVLNDPSAFGNQTFTVGLSSPVGATIGTAQATGTIQDPPPPNSGNVSFQVTTDWGSGFNANITFKNTGTTAWTAWTIQFNFANAIGSIWDASIFSHTGTQYVIQNASYNGAVAPGASVTFGIGGNPGNVTTSPTNYVIHGGGPVNHPPVAVGDSAWTRPGQAATIAVLANDSDPDSDPISITSTTQGAHGSVAINPGGTVTYTPVAGYSGPDSFTYTIGDGRGGSSTATVSMNVSNLSWPSQVFAPYVDMTLVPMTNLASIAQTQGVKYFNLAFVVSDSNNKPSWGGYLPYEVNGGTFDGQIKAQINALRGLGGDVAVSFGGAAGQELAQTITNVSTLQAAYQSVVTDYSLGRIDFDIEGSAVADHASIDRRSQAIAGLQRAALASGTPLQVTFTLPVLPTGLTADGLYVLQSALHYGVNITGVNVMAMDYGDSAAPNPSGQMGTYAIDAATSTFNQIQGLYGTSKTTSQLWSMIGVTPMIGLNDDTSEVFDQAAVRQLVAFAEQKGMGELSMWCLNRDQEDPSGHAINYVDETSSSLVQQPYEFSGIFKAFTH